YVRNIPEPSIYVIELTLIWQEQKNIPLSRPQVIQQKPQISKIYDTNTLSIQTELNMSENILITKRAPTATTQVFTTTAQRPTATCPASQTASHPMRAYPPPPCRCLSLLRRRSLPPFQPVSQLASCLLPPAHLHQLVSSPPLPGEIAKLGNQKSNFPKSQFGGTAVQISNHPKEKGTDKLIKTQIHAPN
ncbi:hypothetical protein DSO57_1001093, partial [Entomophthora muscae]